MAARRVRDLALRALGVGPAFEADPRKRGTRDRVAAMRVAIVTETFLPRINGVVTRLCHTVRHLHRLGDDVLVIAPDADRQEYEGSKVLGLKGFPLPIYPELRVAMPRPAMSRALKKFRPDVIHVVNPVVLGLGGIYYAKTRGVPLVCSFHTHLPRYLHHYRLGALERLVWEVLRSAHNKAQINLCISREMEHELRLRGVERVQLGWRGGVDVELFDAARRDPAMRARLSGGAPERPLLLYVGRLSAEKSVEQLRPLLEEVPGARLAVVGDGPHRAALEAHFAGTPTTFAGYLYGAELAAAYASADAFVFASSSETLGLVLLEAMASGCPVVAARAGGIPDVVDHGVSGFLFDPANPSEAAAQVRSLLADPALAERIRRQGRAQADRWSWASATTELRSWYAAMLAGTAGQLVA